MKTILGVLISATILVNATADCPCLTGTPVFGLEAFVGQGVCSSAQIKYGAFGTTTYECYPLMYGSDCKTHDIELESICADEVGELNALAPPWCSSQWCYVDINNCDAAFNPQLSSVYPDVYYSYEACGTKNTWEEYVANSDQQITGVEQVQKKVQDYIRSITNTLQQFWTTSASEYANLSCEFIDGCACDTCTDIPGWDMGPEKPADSELCYPQPTTNECRTMLWDLEKMTLHGEYSSIEKCFARQYEMNFIRTVKAEAADSTRLGTSYVGMQENGALIQWPATQWCPTTYDARFRPWYASAASGPKDIVILLDVSGSMMSNDRIEMARKAAIKVLDTLLYVDYANIVLFDHEASVFSETMIPMTQANKDKMKTWIEANVFPKGGTNFKVGLERAFNMMMSSRSAHKSSFCKGAVLFLTDGVADWTDEDSEQLIKLNNADYGYSVFSYALGDGADTTITKRIACEHRGLFYHVGDNDDLSDVMSKYYHYFSHGISVAVHYFKSIIHSFTVVLWASIKIVGPIFSIKKKA